MPHLQPALHGIEDRRASPAAVATLDLPQGSLPSSFPMYLWNAQAQRYHEYWSWFTGDKLNEIRARTAQGDPILKFPLGVNPVRNFARKHASVLLGEETFETPRPLVRSRISALPPLDGSAPEDLDKRLARIAGNIVNEVWIQSGGRGLQTENATLSQFLGGCVFQVSWQPQRTDLRIPILIKSVMPDFFLPIWKNDDPWNLLEAYVVYRLPGIVAKEQFGVNTDANKVLYVEHWTRRAYSIYIDGQPITMQVGKSRLALDNVPHPFGFVPFVYIPHLREGHFYGSSHVDDLAGLVKEFNARYADIGDSIRNSVHRKRYMRNVNGETKTRHIGEGVYATDLGKDTPTSKNPPDVFTEDPPTLANGLTEFPDKLWSQLMREGHVSDIAFGEDEGSQRSALTLAFRMWPTTSHSQMERSYWTDGLNLVARMVIRMVLTKIKRIPLAKDLAADTLARVSISQEWLPQIPRDREQQINEIILRFQAGLLSPQRAIEMLGDVDYVDEELELIKQWLQFQASIDAGPGGEDSPGTEGGEGAKTNMQPVVANTGLED